MEEKYEPHREECQGDHNYSLRPSPEIIEESEERCRDLNTGWISLEDFRRMAEEFDK